MVRTHIFACALPKGEGDALNAESGRVYSNTLLFHYRIYRHTGHWLSVGADCRLEDFLGGEISLHAHSRDAAQQAFYRACKTARANRQHGAEVRYPHKRKRYRTTVWKNTGLRVREGRLRLARARGRPAVEVRLPAPLSGLPPSAFREARLVWDRAARHYTWHVVIEDGLGPSPPPGERVAAVDLGEVHPAALCDGKGAVVISARALRSVYQHTAKRLAKLQRRQAAKRKGSRRWKRLQRRNSRFLAGQKRRERDIQHKVSRAVVREAVQRQVGTLVVGDVRDVAAGKRLPALGQQKVSLWSHGRQRQYITYKAEAAGMRVVLESEAYTSQTCPRCGERHKPTGRVFTCPACGFVSQRDAVGAANILSRFLYGEVGQVCPPWQVKYRHPHLAGKRSRQDTAQVARAASSSAERKSREAAAL